MHDAWIHPLAGPTRRMPVNHNGAFGAERAGDRPPECVSGHCGVDVGHVWGEHVYAVHDGVVDFVNRGPNEERGGVFVRISHRDGTLFSWYFHLAAVPRWVRPGEKVSAGQVIGLLGDTGVSIGAAPPFLALGEDVEAGAGALSRSRAADRDLAAVDPERESDRRCALDERSAGPTGSRERRQKRRLRDDKEAMPAAAEAAAPTVVPTRPEPFRPPPSRARPATDWRVVPLRDDGLPARVAGQLRVQELEEAG